MRPPGTANRRSPAAFQSAAVMHGEHAGRGLGGLGIDRLDLCVACGERSTTPCAMPGRLDVVDIAAAAADQSRILETRHALTDGELTHVNFNLSNSCVTGPVTRRVRVPWSRQPVLSFSATRGAK